MIGAGDAMQDVGEAREIPRLASVELGQRPFDLTKAIDRRVSFFVRKPEPFQQRHSPTLLSSALQVDLVAAVP